MCVCVRGGQTSPEVQGNPYPKRRTPWIWPTLFLGGGGATEVHVQTQTKIKGSISTVLSSGATLPKLPSPKAVLALVLHVSHEQGRRHGVTIGGGGRGPFEVDSFHASSIGIMLNAENIAGYRPPPPPDRRPCSRAH